jgi:large subunit ribosomal protein L24
MGMKKIRKGDQVIVLTGKDKGSQGTVLRVINEKVVVEGIGRYKKHVKANPARNITGGIQVEFRPIHVSNVAIWNAATGKADRIGFKVLEDGSKVRLFKSTGEQLV